MSEHFLQSKEWEEFQKSLGREVLRADGVLFIKLPLAFGKSYLYAAGTSIRQNLEVIFAPRKGETSSTPLLDKALDSPLKSQKWLLDFAQRENMVFLKIEPMSEDVSLKVALLEKGFKNSQKKVQPQRTIILDIEKSEEELLLGLRQKTRYNIRIAQRQGVRLQDSVGSVQDFWKLLEATAKRDRFHAHAKEYYEKLLKCTPARLFTVEYGGKIIAANIVIFYGDRATYLHGASDYTYRHLMAPYLLHWEIIKYAKANGFKEYDFWGIDEKKWPGLTRFKRGFTGREIEYIGSYDCVFQPFWYALYNIRNFFVSKLKIFNF